MGKIIITIQNGEITSKVNGVLGLKCKDTDKFLKQIGEVSKEIKTKEFYQSNIEVDNNVRVQR